MTSVTALIHAGRLQLGERLDAIERAIQKGAGLAEQSAIGRRLVGDVGAEVMRARNVAEALERLVALRHTQLRLGQVEVSDLLILTLSRWKTRAPQHTFELALPGHEPTLLGDAALIEQAIESLIAWVTAHCGPGDIRVSLRSAHPAAQNLPTGEEDAVAIGVRGPLRSTEIAQPERLFARFAEPQADGAGEVELALARAIAERHGGRAWAEASDDELALWLALPTAPSAALQRAPDARDDRGDEAAGAPGDAPALTRTRSSVLVAHADARMSRYLRANLEAAGFSATTAASLGVALKVIDLEEPDLIVLDLSLPDEEGRDPLARTLARTTAPVIALGPCVDPSACVAALDAGAVDFIAQPLSVEEALARIRRALRPQRGQTSEPRPRIFTCGDLVIDDTQRLVTVAGTPAALSRTEYRLLRTLAQNTGKILSHEMLLAQVWGPAYSQEIEFVWVYIRRLRRKIEPDPAHPRYIVTAPGIGYRLAQPTAQ